MSEVITPTETASVSYAAGFRPDNQELAVDDLPVTGIIPDWLHGTLIRNGPGAFEVGGQRVRHWFDGLAMLHKFSFAGGRVSYASKFLDCESYRRARSDEKLTISEFATDPCRSMFKKVMTLFSRYPSDNAKVSIAHFAGKALALGETPMQIEFDPETLRSVGVFIHEDGQQGQLTTAHPHFDDEAMYNMVLRFNRISQYRLYRTPPDAAPVRVGTVSTALPAYMHSFGMSPRYVVVTEHPFVVNPITLLLWLRPFIENYRWKPARGTTFYVLDRQTGALVGRYEAEPFFTFHHVNAFERDGEICVDLVAYPDADIIQQYYLKRLEQPSVALPPGELRRYRLKPGQRRADGEALSATGIELPHIDYARHNMDAGYRCVYGVGLRGQHGFYDQIVKLDTVTGNAQTWHADGCYPGEPVFVPSPGSRAEDDGLLLSVVLDGAAGRSFLLVLDATTLHEVGRATLPQAAIFGYHGAFMPGI